MARMMTDAHVDAGSVHGEGLGGHNAEDNGAASVAAKLTSIALFVTLFIKGPTTRFLLFFRTR
jgi:hypothetical protein